MQKQTQHYREWLTTATQDARYGISGLTCNTARSSKGTDNLYIHAVRDVREGGVAGYCTAAIAPPDADTCWVEVSQLGIGGQDATAIIEDCVIEREIDGTGTVRITGKDCHIILSGMDRFQEQTAWQLLGTAWETWERYSFIDGCEDRPLTRAQVAEMLGVHDTSLWRLRKDETAGFPKPVKAGRRLTWYADEIKTWMNAHRGEF